MKIRSMVCTLLIATPALFAGAIPDSAQVTKLLGDAKTQAFQLKEDAVFMESFNYMTVSRETQAATINQIRDHINTLGRTQTKLQEALPEASPWQAKAINSITPYLEELEGYTSAVIDHLSGAVTHNFAEYKDYLEANADYSADLAKLISDYVDYGRTKGRLEDLTNKLEIPAAQ